MTSLLLSALLIATLCFSGKRGAWLVTAGLLCQPCSSLSFQRRMHEQSEIQDASAQPKIEEKGNLDSIGGPAMRLLAPL